MYTIPTTSTLCKERGLLYILRAGGGTKVVLHSTTEKFSIFVKRTGGYAFMLLLSHHSDASEFHHWQSFVNEYPLFLILYGHFLGLS